MSCLGFTSPFASLVGYPGAGGYPFGPQQHFKIAAVALRLSALIQLSLDHGAGILVRSRRVSVAHRHA